MKAGSPVYRMMISKNTFGLVTALLLTAVISSGCGPTSANTSSSTEEGTAIAYPYKVVTTCAMVTDIVQVVAGDKAEIHGLMGEGVDPHLYRPTRNDVKQLMEADVVLYSGLMLEGRMADTFAKIGRQGKPVYAVTEGIDQSFLREPPEFEGHWDPHVWTDPSAWSECVQFAAQALSEYDADNADYYQENAKNYREDLAKLHDYAKEVIGSIPKEQRALITAHDAFGYFGRAYEIDVKSVQGLTTEAEASVDDINKLVDFIVDRKIRAIFVESSVNSKNIEAVIAAAADRGSTVEIGGKLFSDAMGKSGTYEGTYIGMMDHNATIIARGLGGEAPEKGLNGRLGEK